MNHFNLTAKWQQSAPANIALIKYMGKASNTDNCPINDSLSYTLEQCRTSVKLTLSQGISHDCWEPLEDTNFPYKPALDRQGIDKFLSHLKRVKTYYGVSEYYFKVASANNFPDSCGIASSASSFAALTLCAAQALSDLMDRPLPGYGELAKLSCMGSGSSCRSFVAPWALWHAATNEVIKPDIPYDNLLHMVFIVSANKKKISSTQAHHRVVTSMLFKGRAERAQIRLTALKSAFRSQQWEEIYKLVWQEWWDMHCLFETCQQPFGYLEPGSIEISHYFRDLWEKKGDGPLVTLDAGSNVHVLFRPDQADLMIQSRQFFSKKNIKMI